MPDVLPSEVLDGLILAGVHMAVWLSAALLFVLVFLLNPLVLGALAVRVVWRSSHINLAVHAVARWIERGVERLAR